PAAHRRKHHRAAQTSRPAEHARTPRQDARETPNGEGRPPPRPAWPGTPPASALRGPTKSATKGERGRRGGRQAQQEHTTKNNTRISSSWRRGWDSNPRYGFP